MKEPNRDAPQAPFARLAVGIVHEHHCNGYDRARTTSRSTNIPANTTILGISVAVITPTPVRGRALTQACDAPHARVDQVRRSTGRCHAAGLAVVGSRDTADRFLRVVVGYAVAGCCRPLAPTVHPGRSGRARAVAANG
jgi:hypothetical protein